MVEKLDFRGGGLSRRMNRLLARTYRKVIKDKLARLEEKYGITTVEVNAAYTSQECSKCGFVSKGNRNHKAPFIAPVVVIKSMRMSTQLEISSKDVLLMSNCEHTHANTRFVSLGV